MADAEVEKRLVSVIGKQLAAHKSCPNKDLLVKLLREAVLFLACWSLPRCWHYLGVFLYFLQATSSFPVLDKSSSLKPAIKPLIDSLVKHNLVQHKDKDARLLVAICICEVILALAPNPDFTTAIFKSLTTPKAHISQGD
ncbi:sister chromatid cohesion protein PDS5 homolog B-like isoform X1 [Actinidia eriantha]|uniref:sister chromatid cohesion protein PDS5 homolog B-like isoform X1 n=1 Tax=Actinidia eriantha TaxID=165200 RepID=UPI0025908657|nr:sister chromatid cohesion protein PDS5 homolog B-like isoform X1 [Actinidia eriantha]